eukprot:9589417-Alexandrium_andersonii.AAC.1
MVLVQGSVGPSSASAQLVKLGASDSVPCPEPRRLAPSEKDDAPLPPPSGRSELADFRLTL